MSDYNEQDFFAPQTNDFDTTAYAGKTKKPISGVRVFFTAFAGALVALALGTGGLAAAKHFDVLPSVVSDLFGKSTTVTLGSGSSAQTITVEGDNPTLAEAVAEKALPSIAAIDVYTRESTRGGYGYYGYGYGGQGGGSDSSTLTQSSLGSGVVLTEDGYIITNYHVIADSDALIVTVGGEEYDATVVGYDSSSDVAVIKAEGASGLTPIEIGDSDALHIGEWVMTIGSPFGLEQSVATGVVSATSRSQVLADSTTGETTIYANMIQTDAAINPGNSGGALVNSRGELIGINTLITSYSGNYSGVGFAIPTNYAIPIAEKLIKGETPTHAQLGVTLSSVTASMAQRNGLSTSSGAYIASVNEGTGAAEAGLQPGDIIVSFNGSKVESSSDVMVGVRGCNPGDTVTLGINRDGKTLDVSVTLGESGGKAESSGSERDASSFFNGGSRP